MNPVSQTQSGFSLVEVMVAVLVLAIGLLGLAALQATGLSFNHQSYERTQAVLQAYDIIDRMRSNKSTTAGSTVDSTYDSVALGATPGSTDCAATTCSTTQLAEYDIRKWNQANAAMLGEGRGAICKGSFSSDLSTCTTSGSVYRVVITWKEKEMDMRLDVETQI